MAEPYDRSIYGVDLVVAKAAGYDLTAWQRDVLMDWCAVGPGDCNKWVHKRCGASIPRQAGKSVVGIVHAASFAVSQAATVLWTDHNYSTTKEMLRRFQAIFGRRARDRTARNRELNGMVLRVDNTTAQEAIYLKNGGSIHFSTRTKGTALGFSFDMVVYDEAQELTDEHVQAITPTTTSGRLHDLQLLYLGTPTRPRSLGTVFRSVRDDARSGSAADLSWWEWGVDEIGDVHDESRWYAANPSLAEGVADPDAIRTALEDMSGEAFAQEYLGWWLPAVSSFDPPVFGEGGWAAGSADGMPDGGRRALGVRFSPDGSEVDVAEAALGPDGAAVVAVTVHAPTAAYGLARLADRLADRLTTSAGCAAIDGRSYSGALAQLLADRRVPPSAYRLMTAADAVSACATLASSVAEGTARHVANGALDPAMAAVTKRLIGKSGGWGFAGDGEGPATACAQALWALRTSTRDPTRRARIG